MRSAAWHGKSFAPMSIVTNATREGIRDVVLDAGPVLDLAEAIGVLPEAVRPALLDVKEAPGRVVVGDPRPPADGNSEERADPIVDREFGPHLALRRHQLPEPPGRTQNQAIVLRP
jgi:hypothetical protein